MIETTKFFFNKAAHTEYADELNILANNKKVQVSRWVNNSKGRQIVTYMVHEGDRNQFASKQENVLFTVSEDAGRGGRVTDEMDMMRQVRQFLNSIKLDEPESNDTDDASEIVVYFNISDGYGDFIEVTLADYTELNPDAEFETDYQYGMDVITQRTGDDDNPFEIVAVGFDADAGEDQFDSSVVKLSEEQIVMVNVALGREPFTGVDGGVSVQAAAAAAGVSVQAVRDVLRDDARRAEIMPNSRKYGSVRGGVWVLSQDDVRNWKPREYPR